jgi:hypothetical protein
MARLRLQDLLNPVLEVDEDARPEILALRSLLANISPGPILVTPEQRRTLRHTIEQLRSLSVGPAPEEALRSNITGQAPAEPPNTTTFSVPNIVTENDVYLNYKTMLATLYRYPPNTYIEYPETGTEPIGHLFQLDPQNWERPNLDFAYSQGKPAGQSLKNEEITCPILVDGMGELVPCIRRFSTCEFLNVKLIPESLIHDTGQGLKACPFNDLDDLTSGHTQASRNDIEQRLQDERENRLESWSPHRDVFKRTAAYIATLRNNGCTRKAQEPTLRTEEEQREVDDHHARQDNFRRGYVKSETCAGRIIFKKCKKPYLMYSFIVFLLRAMSNHPFDRCEHYSSQNKDHWADFTIADGSYDLDYLEAIFAGDNDAVHAIEDKARLSDYGPLAPCSFLSNFTSKRIYCRQSNFNFISVRSDLPASKRASRRQ